MLFSAFRSCLLKQAWSFPTGKTLSLFSFFLEEKCFWFTWKYWSNTNHCCRWSFWSNCWAFLRKCPLVSRSSLCTLLARWWRWPALSPCTCWTHRHTAPTTSGSSRVAFSPSEAAHRGKACPGGPGAASCVGCPRTAWLWPPWRVPTAVRCTRPEWFASWSGSCHRLQLPFLRYPCLKSEEKNDTRTISWAKVKTHSQKPRFLKNSQERNSVPPRGVKKSSVHSLRFLCNRRFSWGYQDSSEDCVGICPFVPSCSAFYILPDKTAGARDLLLVPEWTNSNLLSHVILRETAAGKWPTQVIQVFLECCRHRQ